MKKTVLVIIKPDGVAKSIIGHVLNKFSEADLEIVGIKFVQVTKELAEAHYQQIKGQPFFVGVIEYLMGQYHNHAKSLAIVYSGEDAIKKCRAIAGATNPELASPKSIRGSFGRITTKGVYENVVHVSSDMREARREIALWFQPDEIQGDIYPTKLIKETKKQRRVWK